MKFSLIALAAVVGTAAAGKPQLSISVQDGSFDGLDGLNPTINWEGSSSSGDLDLSYGVEADARPTTDIASLPRNVWGKASTNVAGWGVSARAERDVAGGSTGIELDADNEDADLSVRVVASADGGFNVGSVEATKGLDMNGARVTINPRHNMESGDSDVVVSYDDGSTNVQLTASADAQEVSATHNMGDTTVGVTASADSQEVTINHTTGDTNLGLTASADSQELTVDHTAGDTNLKLTASADAQEVTITQQIDDSTSIAPTINNSGDISVAYNKQLDDGSLTATLTPNESLDVEWNDGDWTANVNCGLDGINVDSANVSIKRDITF